MCEINWDLVIKAAGVFTTILAAYLVYHFTRINMRNETIERISRFKNEKLLEAGMAFWSLLAYISPSENGHSIIVWIRKKDSTDKEYYFQPEQAKAFIRKLNEVNYEKGFGLFLSIETRELFYKYRSIVYGILLAEKNNTGEKILLSNDDMVRSMFNLYDKMVVELRKEIRPRQDATNSHDV